MINIDDRLLAYVDANELYFLMHLAKRINPLNNSCWPSNKTLCKDTKWHIDKIQKVKKALMDRGLLVVSRRNDNSNVYQIKTSHIGYYVNATHVEFVENDSIPENPVEGSIGFNPPPSTGKSSSKVLTSEVLTSKHVASATTGFLPDFKTPKKKVKKPVDPAYMLCVDIWLKEIHTDFIFTAQSGKALNSIIKKIQTTLTANGGAFGFETVISFFRVMCKNLPEWFKDKDLSVIDQKYNEIITQIQNAGKITKGNQFTGTDWIDRLYGG